MARGPRVTPGPVALPKAQFERIKDDVSTQPNGVHDNQARSFGYNDFSEFARPDYYIRHIEPLEIDLARQVEYDMDEQDQEWLELVNTERKKEQLDRVSFESFEIIMDRLEKEWFDLTKNLPKPDLAMPSEDSTCAICDDSEGENSNAIVFCDGCNLAVHQDCYGVPYIPEGQWLCRKCTVSPENPVSCSLCPNEGGAFKQTVHGDWMHLLCAIWIPETRVANEVFMEPITGEIPRQRWKLKCSLCNSKMGACIQCAKSSCFVAFHTTCARAEKLLLPMKTTQGSEPVTLQAYCERHLPKEQQEVRAAALAAEAQKAAQQYGNAAASKSARAYNKTYKPGPPIVPAIIVNRIVQYINKIKLRRKNEFVQLVCRYWSLKREARRGAPLLKRLHLEPWTASGGKIASDEEKQMKLDQLKRLRQDLVQLKTLTQLTRLREMRKLRQTEIIHQILAMALFPHESALRMTLEQIMAADRNDYFKNPVNKNEVPDYFDVVLNPMCWSIIEDRLDKHEYWDIQTFKDDVNLVIANALLYNKPGTPHYKVAYRLQGQAKNLLDKLNHLATPAHALIPHPPAPAAPRPPSRAPTEHKTKEEAEDTPPPPSEAPHPPYPPLGDLEPPLDVLSLLSSAADLRDELNLEIDSDTLLALFSFEFAKYKPAAPPSPVLQGKTQSGGGSGTTTAAAGGGGGATSERSHKKKKRDRKAEYERAKARKAAAAAAAAAASAGGTGEGDDPFTAGSSNLDDAGQSNRSKKRSSSSSTPLPGAPRVVEDVDNRGSFQLFNAGWILPADHRRGGRAPPTADTKALQPPPKKRQKTEHHSHHHPGSSSRLSIVSTAASENQTLQTPGPDEPHVMSKMEVDSPLVSSGGFAFPPPPSGTGGSAASSFAVPPPTTAGTSRSVSGASLPPPTPTSPGTMAAFEDGKIARTVTDASGRLVMEVLDTPATRKQRTMKRKAERERMRRESLVAGGDGPGPSGQAKGNQQEGGATSAAAGGSRKASGASARAAGTDDDSDLSELSDLSDEDEGDEDAEGEVDEDAEGEVDAGDEDGEGEHDSAAEESPTAGPSRGHGTARTRGGKRKAPAGASRGVGRMPKPPPIGSTTRSSPKKGAGPPARRASRVEHYESGTLVWAKAESYPWWPAVVFDCDHPDVPPNIVEEYKITRTRRKLKLYIVRFYDRNNSWQYLPRDKLQLLGEDSKLDGDMLAPQSLNQKWKSASARTTCRDAYRKACAEMETKSDQGTPGFEAVIGQEGAEEEV